MTEQWRPIPGFEGRYDVSDHGSVRSWSPRRGRPGPYPVATSLDYHGYPRLTLYVDGTRHYRTVHVLVALAFLGPRPDGADIRHLDGDSLNPRLSNLAYGTRSENAQDRLRHGHHHHASKTHCKHGHEFTPENTSVTKAGARECRACRARQQRERRARHGPTGSDR